MIVVVLKSRRDFDLAQAYLASAINIHRLVSRYQIHSKLVSCRALLWRNESEDEGKDEILEAMEEISQVRRDYGNRRSKIRIWCIGDK